MLSKKSKNDNGITLVALVITIIILLILAGISISALTNTGIFKSAKDAKTKSEEAEKKQSQTLGEYEKELNKYVAEGLTDDKLNVVLNKDENTVLKDANGNVFIVPAGFKVVVNEDTNNVKTVDKGIVIEDATSAETAGSKFVWVPVGKIKKGDGTIVEINLNRYTFDTNGNPISQNENIIDNYYQELTTSDKGNTVAKSISDFKISVATNGGYYIGRYEARTTTARNNKENPLTQITEKGTEQIYNYVTQMQATQLSQNMYNSNKFISDLTNSYAWDTTTLFLQTCGEAGYSRKLSTNSTLANKGTNASNYVGTRDEQCNIFDMASNIFEWTTETSNTSTHPCIYRGGHYGNNSNCTIYRNGSSVSSNNDDIGFRPILYINV